MSNIVNVFPPNGDGKNDEFTFSLKAKGILEFNCTILNRWGKTAGQLSSIHDSWDGKDNAETEFTSGIYFHLYEGMTVEGDQLEVQGTVTLMR